MGKRSIRLTLAVALVASAGTAASAQPDGDCGLELPEIAERAGPPPVKPRGLLAATLGAAVSRVRGGAGAPRVARPFAGALSGKTIYVSAGHGWTWMPGSGAWETQRSTTHELVEDLVSTETMAYFLIPYLRNMGAYVVPVREPDVTAAMAIVDDDDDGFTVEGGLALDADADGYAVPSFPVVGALNPFAAGSSRTFATSSERDAAAVWTFDVPADGDYNVYVGYVQDPTRAPDAHYVVRHAGGEAEFRVDQRRHGSTWVLLGRFAFERGRSPERGAVALYADSTRSEATLSADVARIGGGAGLIDRGGGAHDRPMFELCSRYHAQLAGAPTSVYATAGSDRNDDIATRSRFAAWDHEPGEDAIYIAWHTNAPEPLRGTESFAYGPSAYGPLSEFSGIAGSLELMDAVHDELVGDVRGLWDAGWPDRGQHTAFFGEINPSHNPEMPAVLFEIGFHATATDAAALRDPRFRRLAARAIAHGVARYFAERDGEPLTLSPDPPVKLWFEQVGGELSLHWSPSEEPRGGDPASRYRVYLSRDGRAFDDGQDVSGQSLAIPAGGAALYARVTAVNDGGESLPSRIVGASPSSSGAAPVLVVNGFSRLDGAMAVRDDLSEHGLGTVDRGFIDRMNDGSYVSRYGAAITAAGIDFDSADASAVEAGEVDLARYRAVLWFVGEESTADLPLSDRERDLVTAYVDGGGALLVSGAELAWTLVARGAAATQSFASDVLRIAYVSDDADTYAATGVGAFADVGTVEFDDRASGGYDADFPDVIEPVSGGESILRYGGGVEGGAATSWNDRVIVFGFPFETIAGAQARARVMAAVMTTFGIEPDDPLEPPPPDDPDDRPGGGCGCRAGGPSQNSLGLLALAVCAVAISVRWRSRKQSRRRTSR